MADVGGPSAAARLCPQPDLLLALGIVSAPDYHMRRMAQRHSWMRWPNVGHFDGAAICASFIVRAGNAPAVIASALRREADAHGDMLLVSEIAHNESRVRGPLLSVAKWLLYAHSAMAHAAFIGKLDDDAYVHAPDLERMLRTAGTTFGPSANVYLGGGGHGKRARGGGGRHRLLFGGCRRDAARVHAAYSAALWRCAYGHSARAGWSRHKDAFALAVDAGLR